VGARVLHLAFQGAFRTPSPVIYTTGNNSGFFQVVTKSILQGGQSTMVKCHFANSKLTEK